MEDAIAPFDEYIGLGPTGVFYWLALSTKACALTAMGCHEQAITCSQDAQARSASARFSFFGEICALGHLGRKDEASDVVRRAERTNPGSCAALFDALLSVGDDRVARHMHEGFQRAGLG